MVSMQTENLKANLSKRISGFLSNSNKVPFRQPVYETLRQIQEEARSAYLFGGAIRDMMNSGASAMPRDLDIVVSDITDSMLQVLEANMIRRTRFGGFHLDSQGWAFDVWGLPDTWAFREGIVDGRDFSDLPKTTFLNIHAIVAEITPRKGKKRRIYANGFFEAFANKTIDINCEENPFPNLCIVRAFLAAAKFDFAIAPRLAKYIVHHVSHCEVEELVQVQREHYGRVYGDADILRQWLKMTRDQLRTSSQESVRLPGNCVAQLELPFANP